MEHDRLISLKEAAALTGVSHSHLRLLARTGKIEARRFGRDWFTTEQAVASYLKEQAASEQPSHRTKQS